MAKRIKIPLSRILIFFVSVLIISLSGYIYFLQKIKDIKEREQEKLSLISDLKTGQIINWRNERFSDGLVILNNAPLIRSVQKYFEGKSPILAAEEDITGRLLAFQKSLQYENVLLFDANATLRISLDHKSKEICAYTQSLLKGVLREGKIVISNLFRCGNGEINLDILIPLLDPQLDKTGVIGIILLRVDPRSFLYPLVESWPTLQYTAETLLVSREGENVVFLNNLRHRKESALNLKFPLTMSKLPVAMAVQGKTGIVEGIDYRGVPVLSAINRIPGSPWFIVAKVDKKEIYASVRQLVFYFVIALCLFIVSLVALIGLYLSKRNAAFFQRQLNEEFKRKKTEEALVVSEMRYRRLFETAKDGILLLNAETGEVVDVNPFLTDMLGYNYQELCGRKIWELGLLKDIVASRDAFLGLQIEGYVRYEDLPLQTKKGENIEVEFVSNVYLVDHQKVIQCNIRDISDRKKKEAQLREAMAVKSAFTSMVSHELRTPLTAIKEGIAIVQEGAAGDINEVQAEFLGIAKKNVDRLTRLINDVLDFQKLDSGKMTFEIRENDINEAVQDVFNTMLPLVNERNLGLTVEFTKGLQKVNFDRDKVVQVIANLVSNAIECTEKGSIVITTSAGDNFIRVSVKDTGRGIKETDLPRLFQQFEQLKSNCGRKTGGTGLGLAISRQIIEAHNGRIWAESEFGKGSTFSFILPINDRRK